MTRRTFIGGGLSAAVCGCRTWTRGDGYSVVLLGDTHFDGQTPDVYHAGWVPRDEQDRADRAREFMRNAEMWKSRLPSLIASAAAVRREDTAFVLHVGDLIQGDTASAGMQFRMLCDAEHACRKGMEDLPFHVVCGNHDLRNGGAAGFDRYQKQSTRLLTHGPDAFLMVDFMRPDPDRVERLLSETDGARHTFVVSHGLLSPHDGWGYYWFLFGKKSDTEIRRHFRHAFAKRNVIALGGHIHRTALMDWRHPEGRITQFVANSVWADRTQGNGVVEFSCPAQFGTYVKNHPAPMGEEHDGCHQNRTPDEARALVDEYREGLVRYRVVRAAGHYLLHVGDAVSVEFFPGDRREPSETLRLRS